MSLYLDTTGNSSLAVAICARCSRKMPIGELSPDPNYPGLLVCEYDRDLYDPYRLPARQTERISLNFVRPDLPLGLSPPSPVAPNPVLTEDGRPVLTEDGLDIEV